MPKSSKRPSISKSLRFEVFVRDAFTCRYCGRKSDEVKLVLDHVIPFSKGGTSDRENLATSCEDCNSGKSAKNATPPPEGDNARMARLQLLREQEESARAVVNCVKAQNKFRQAVLDAWADITGRDEYDVRALNVVICYVEQFGMAVVLPWILKAYAIAGSNDVRMGKYISGIRRRYIAELNPEEPASET